MRVKQAGSETGCGGKALIPGMNGQRGNSVAVTQQGLTTSKGTLRQELRP